MADELTELETDIKTLFFKAADSDIYYSVVDLTKEVIRLVNADMRLRLNDLLKKWTMLTEGLPLSDFNNGRLAALIQCIEDLKGVL